MSDTVAATAVCGAGDMSAAARHQRAVAQTFRFAQDAAATGDFGEALEWLAVVESVDGGLPADWELTRDSWLLAGGPGAAPRRARMRDGADGVTTLSGDGEG